MPNITTPNSIELNDRGILFSAKFIPNINIGSTFKQIDKINSGPKDYLYALDSTFTTLNWPYRLAKEITINYHSM